jgi:hypothetical protein
MAQFEPTHQDIINDVVEILQAEIQYASYTRLLSLINDRLMPFLVEKRVVPGVAATNAACFINAGGIDCLCMLLEASTHTLYTIHCRI